MNLWNPFVQSVVCLHCYTAVPVLALYFAYGASDAGVGPYLYEVESAVNSGPELFEYSLLIIAYSVSWEFVIRRGLQAWLAALPTKLAVPISISFPACVYSLIHLRYGATQCLMAFLVSLLCGISFNRH